MNKITVLKSEDISPAIVLNNATVALADPTRKKYKHCMVIMIDDEDASDIWSTKIGRSMLGRMHLDLLDLANG